MNKKAVLITGGARRIGAALAEGFANSGYEIALHYNNSKDEAEELANNINAKLYQANLTDSGAAQKLIKSVKNDFPNLCCLINNASHFRRIPLQDSTEQTVNEDIAINLIAPLNLMREFSKNSSADNCSIINMLDVGIYDDYSPYFAYLIAKKGLAEATKMAAQELAPNIRVNGICPGYTLPSEGEGHKELTTAVKTSVTQIVQTAITIAEDTSINAEWISLNIKDS